MRYCSEHGRVRWTSKSLYCPHCGQETKYKPLIDGETLFFSLMAMIVGTVLVLVIYTIVSTLYHEKKNKRISESEYRQLLENLPDEWNSLRYSLDKTQKHDYRLRSIIISKFLEDNKDKLPLLSVKQMNAVLKFTNHTKTEEFESYLSLTKE